MSQNYVGEGGGGCSQTTQYIPLFYYDVMKRDITFPISEAIFSSPRKTFDKWTPLGYSTELILCKGSPKKNFVARPLRGW